MLKKFLYLLIVFLLSSRLMAQEEENRISYRELSFTIPSSLPQNVNIYHFAGDPYDLMYPGGPQPAHVEITLYDALPVPELWDASVVIYLYRTEDFAGYDYHLTEYENLVAILAERPELSTFESTEEFRMLPELPVATATQVVRAHSQYRETCTYKGISYLAYHGVDVSPFVPSWFSYMFQAISVDGQYYISAHFSLNTTLFPNELPADFNYDTFADNYENYIAESAATLAAASPDDFSPSLTVLDAMITDLNFGGSITECF